MFGSKWCPRMAIWFCSNWISLKCKKVPLTTNVVKQKVKYFLTAQCPLNLVFTLIFKQSLLSTFFRCNNIAFECLKLLLFVGTRVRVFSLNSVKTQVKNYWEKQTFEGKPSIVMVYYNVLRIFCFVYFFFCECDIDCNPYLKSIFIEGKLDNETFEPFFLGRHFCSNTACGLFIYQSFSCDNANTDFLIVKYFLWNYLFQPPHEYLVSRKPQSS